MTQIGEMMARVAGSVPGAFAFDATKLRLNQGKDGWLLTLVIHPDDYSTELAMAPIGTQLSVLMVKCDETTGSPPEVDVEPAPEPAPSADAKPEKRKRSWDEMSRSEQAGTACASERFQQWLHAVDEAAAASLVRIECGVLSRRELNASAKAAARWDALYTRYLTETGQIAEARG